MSAYLLLCADRRRTSKKVTDFLRAYLRFPMLIAGAHSIPRYVVFFSRLCARCLLCDARGHQPISGWSTKICFVVALFFFRFSYVNDNEVKKWENSIKREEFNGMQDIPMISILECRVRNHALIFRPIIFGISHQKGIKISTIKSLADHIRLSPVDGREMERKIWNPKCMLLK